MWLGIWVALALKILLITTQNDAQPVCKKPHDCSGCNYECHNAYNHANLTLSKTNDSTMYMSQLISPSRCFVNELVIGLYKYDYNESECNNKMNRMSNYKLHTWQKFICDDKMETMTSFSSGNASVPSTYLFYNLDMIFNGCYVLEYLIKPHGKEPKVHYAWIDNNVTEEEVLKRAKSLKYHNNLIRHASPITIGMQYKVYSKKDYNIEIFNQSMGNLDVTSYSNVTQLYGGTEIKCYLPMHLAGGNYTLQYKCLLGWCHGEMFTRTSQVQEFNITLVNELGDHHTTLPLPIKSSGLKMTVFSMCVLAVTIAGLAGLAYYHLSRRKILPERQKNLIQQFGTHRSRLQRDSSELKGILLVYARDCEPFMRAMIEFRQLLAQRCHVEVYDIYDVALSDRLSAEWAIAMLQSSCVHIVLVETKVGHLLYDLNVYGDKNLTVRPPLVPTSVRYRQHRFNNTFVHTLFHLVRHGGAQPDSYLKYSVVKIPDFSDPRQFSHVNRYERFDLPDGAGLLLAKLTGQPAPEPAEPERGLRRALDDLTLHVSQNADYIDDLLDL